MVYNGMYLITGNAGIISLTVVSIVSVVIITIIIVRVISICTLSRDAARGSAFRLSCHGFGRLGRLSLELVQVQEFRAVEP